jgi:hypothetical protein
MYLAFSFVRNKYPICQTSNDGFIDLKPIIKVKDECEEASLNDTSKS